MLIDKEYLTKNLMLDLETASAATDAVSRSREGSSEAQTVIQRGKEIVLNDDPEAAFRKIERLLSVRDRSVAEITSRLQRDRFTRSAIDEALERALRCGYLDDERFADGFIRQRLRASKGINGIVRDLKQHHIDAYSIPGFPDVFLEEQGSQLDNAVRLLERKPPRAKNKRQAAYAKLIRNGFSSSVASSAVKVWIASQEA